MAAEDLVKARAEELTGRIKDENLILYGELIRSLLYDIQLLLDRIDDLKKEEASDG